MKDAEKKLVWLMWLRRGLLAALTLAAGLLWWTEGRQMSAQDEPPLVTPAPTNRQEERLKRETAYDRDVAALQAILESGSADAATQEMAAQKLTELIEEHEHEIGLETALLEAGYENAVVLVQNGAVTVMIPEELLNEGSGAQLLELCVVHAGVGAENVRVMGLER